MEDTHDREVDVSSEDTALGDQVREVLKRFWGFDRLRPLQEEAIRANLEGRDSLLVLPTGGGKSLTYQLPPLVKGSLDLVVSPLVSLMKDQVDGLREAGVPAVAFDGNLSGIERTAIRAELEEGTYRLLFLSPEMLLGSSMLPFLRGLDVRAVAIDEAHCISQWGHDFRPEYRQLARLRDVLPDVSIHACTATATPRVREDILEQLGLREAEVLVGSFDRPNLTFRIRPRENRRAQILEEVRRHAGEAVIVYALSRRDTEQIADALRGCGGARRALPRGHVATRSQPRPRGVRARKTGRGRRNRGLRDGDRPQQRARGGPRRDAALDRALPTGKPAAQDVTVTRRSASSCTPTRTSNGGEPSRNVPSRKPLQRSMTPNRCVRRFRRRNNCFRT